MKPHKDEQKLVHTPQKATKRRFQIEKLEERIAPWGCRKTNPHGKCVGGPPLRGGDL